jgi:Dolichyl-phosphate-mannose-protein mannosyltransferase
LRFWIVLLLAIQYVLFQLIWPVEYQDAPRNLHWGIYLTEEPRFLLDAEDTYDRTYGFPPEDLSLAPAHLARDQGTWFHPWWGPLYPLLIAFFWKLSTSYTLLQLFSPLCAGLVVLMTYLFGARYFNRRIGFTAALLLAITPIFREHAVLSFTEPVGALLLLGAFWSHLKRNSLWTVIAGSLSVLMKIDLILIYFGTIVTTEWLHRRDHKSAYDPRHAFASLGIPGVIAGAWLFVNYGINNRPMTVMGAPNVESLMNLAPLVLEQFFTTVPLFTYLTLGLMILCIALAVWQRSFADVEVYRLLGIWSGLGIIVLLVYMLFPGAANNPRVLIPAFPALFLLIAAGINQLAVRPRMVVESYLVLILAMMSAVGALYQLILSEELEATMPAWEVLRDEPKGYVMTEYFWHANLYARQPSTWFLGDPVYEHHILHDLENFQPYLEEYPIRYVMLPLEDDPARQYDSRFVQIYQALGIGRMLELRSESVAAPEVRTFLEETYPQEKAGEYVIFRIR